MAMDEDLAKQQVAGLTEEQIDEIIRSKEDRDAEVKIPLEGYTMEVEKLNQLIDEVGLLRHAVISAVSSGKAKHEFKPAPRPKSAVQEAIEEATYNRERQSAHSLMGNLGF